MNSEEERDLFEAYGWERNLVKRYWLAPAGVKLPVDDVMVLTDTPEGEAYLRRVIARYGRTKQ